MGVFSILERGHDAASDEGADIAAALLDDWRRRRFPVIISQRAALTPPEMPEVGQRLGQKECTNHPYARMTQSLNLVQLISH